MKQTMINLTRAAMTLLLAVLTSTTVWADEETFAQPELSLGDLTATSAQIQCSLNGGEAWDLRYRVVAEGEHTMRWSLMMDLTDRSFTLKNLHPDTEYEVQARSVYNDGDDFSDWTPSLKFTTGEDDGIDDLDDDEDICKECAKGDMAEAICVLKGPKGGWYGFAVQIVDAETGTEMAYLRTDEMLDGGTIWLCCGRKYKVNWIHDQQHWQSRGSYAFSLFFEPGDEIYTMHYGEAPENDGLLTQFVMDCGDYCAQRPTNLTATDVTYESATLSYNALTLCEQIAYTTDPEANPDDLRCVEVNRSEKEDQTTYLLNGLEPSTTYYIWVRSVCAGEEGGGYSRWTDRIEVTTKSPTEPPSQIEVSAKSAKKIKLKWKRQGKEKRWNVCYRKQGQGVTVSESQIVTFGFGAGNGFGNQYGGDIYNSKSTLKTYENVLVVGGAHDGDALVFGARQRNSSADDAKFIIGSQKMDRTATLSAQAQQFIQQQRQDETATPDPTSQELRAEKTLMKFFFKAIPSPKARAKHAAVAEPDECYFYIRHNEVSALSDLSIEDLMLIPAENIGEWTVISNVTTTEFMLNGLEPGTTYDIMVQPVYDDGTIGDESPITVFTTLGEMADPLSGTFSVANGKQVCFSKGNLNFYSHNGGEWSFAEHQYDARGNGNLVTIGNTTYVGDRVDLFCWSTTGNQYGTTGYTATDENFDTLFDGPFADWGENANLISTLGPDWQTLSQTEWSYLLCQRPNAAQRVAYAVVNNVSGIILLPDEWTTPTGISLLTADENGIALITDGFGPSYESPDEGLSQINTYTATQWTQLENAGAVFLPAAGILGYGQDGNATVVASNLYGCYWSGSDIELQNYEEYAFLLMFNSSGDMVPFYPQPYQFGSAVRLVKPVAYITPSITLDESYDNRSLLAEVDGEVCNVTLNRTLKTGSYNTFAAPFDIDAATLSDMGVKAKKLVGSSLTDDVLTLIFADATTIEAGHPYLVKLTSDFDLPILVLDAVTMSKTPVTIQTTAADFVPTLGMTTITGSSTGSVIFLGADNTLYRPTALPADMKGFRAYFQLKGQAAANARTVKLDLGDGEATGIGDMQSEGKLTDDAWYMLDGRRMAGKPQAKGVYVKNGQTVIIK